MALDLQSPKSKLAILAFFFALCLFLFINSILMISRSISSHHWPVTTGRMLKSEVYWDADNSRNTDRYVPNVKFTYTVNGKEYQSTRFKIYNPTVHSRSLAEEMLGPYPVNAEVEVHYSPHHPGVADLQPGITGRIFMMLFISGIFVIVITVVSFLIFKKMKKGESL